MGTRAAEKHKPKVSVLIHTYLYTFLPFWPRLLRAMNYFKVIWSDNDVILGSNQCYILSIECIEVIVVIFPTLIQNER